MITGGLFQVSAPFCLSGNAFCLIVIEFLTCFFSNPRRVQSMFMYCYFRLAPPRLYFKNIFLLFNFIL